MVDHKFDPQIALQRLLAGDEKALADLFSFHRDRLWAIVDMRLDRRLTGRVDADDVLQEAFLDAVSRITYFVNEHSGSLFIWLRMVVLQSLANLHRRHLDSQKRDAKRERSLFARDKNHAMSTSLSLQLLGHLTSPSNALMRQEMSQQLENAVATMVPLDREVLTLRHFEQLTNSEVAEVLEITQKAASIRYTRALERLKPIIQQIEDLADQAPNSENASR